MHVCLHIHYIPRLCTVAVVIAWLLALLALLPLKHAKLLPMPSALARVRELFGGVRAGVGPRPRFGDSGMPFEVGWVSTGEGKQEPHQWNGNC